MYLLGERFSSELCSANPTQRQQLHWMQDTVAKAREGNVREGIARSSREGGRHPSPSIKEHQHWRIFDIWTTLIDHPRRNILYTIGVGSRHVPSHDWKRHRTTAIIELEPVRITSRYEQSQEPHSQRRQQRRIMPWVLPEGGAERNNQSHG